MKKENKHFLSFIISIIIYTFFIIYEYLEKLVNYLLLKFKIVKKYIGKIKEFIYKTKIYKYVKLKIDVMNEKVYLSLIVFLIVSSGLLIYILPFIIKSAFFKILSIVLGKLFSTTNLIVSGMGIQKIFKIPLIRFFRAKVKKVKEKLKQKISSVIEKLKPYIQKLKVYFSNAK